MVMALEDSSTKPPKEVKRQSPKSSDTIAEYTPIYSAIR